jgi:hypothetical protein
MQATRYPPLPKFGFAKAEFHHIKATRRTSCRVSTPSLDHRDDVITLRVEGIVIGHRPACWSKIYICNLSHARGP